MLRGVGFICLILTPDSVAPARARVSSDIRRASERGAGRPSRRGLRAIENAKFAERVGSDIGNADAGAQEREQSGRVGARRGIALRRARVGGVERETGLGRVGNDRAKGGRAGDGDDRVPLRVSRKRPRNAIDWLHAIDRNPAFQSAHDDVKPPALRVQPPRPVAIAGRLHDHDLPDVSPRRVQLADERIHESAQEVARAELQNRLCARYSRPYPPSAVAGAMPGATRRRSGGSFSGRPFGHVRSRTG